MSDNLPRAVLGRTNLSVTRLGWGAADRRVWNEDLAESMCNSVLEAGINYVDTANDYGRSEEFIGKLISHRRDEFYLASKCGCVPGGGSHVWTEENAFRGLHESLSRLKTDYLDLMQLHNPTVNECERGRLVAALNEMRDQGKVRWIGISTTLPHLPTFLEWGVFDTFQIPYSALERQHEEWITQVAEAGIGTVVRGGVALGEPGQGLGIPERWRGFSGAKLEDLQEADESRTAFMLRFTLTHPSIDTIIVGTQNPAHLRENVVAVNRGPLPADVYEEAKRRLSAAGLLPAAAQ
jgi:aryl-alcohol dehydrogenase-like predicted oxidoreductase